MFLIVKKATYDGFQRSTSLRLRVYSTDTMADESMMKAGVQMAGEEYVKELTALGFEAALDRGVVETVLPYGAMKYEQIIEVKAKFVGPSKFDENDWNKIHKTLDTKNCKISIELFPEVNR